MSPITFEEITGEVGPERGRERRGGEGERPGGASEQALEEKIRAVLAREQRRAERLSDQ